MEVEELIISSYNKTNRFGRELGMEYTILEKGKVAFTMKINEYHLATASVAHGGAVAAMMDSTLGLAALSLTAHEAKIVSTVSLNMNFLLPVKLNDELKALGKVIRAGKRILFTEAHIINQNQEIIASGSGTFNAYPVEKIMPKI
jgi:uncharacterized protein (TIGR00369 family)